MKINYLLVVLLSTCFLQTKGQDFFLPLNHELNSRYDELLANKDVKFMPTVRPYRADELRACIPFDSLENDLAKKYYPNWRKERHSWANRKIFSEHLVDVIDTEDHFRLHVDPVFDIKVGRNQTVQPKTSLAPKSTFTNTRGFQIEGDVGRKFLFYSAFYENQASFPYYLDSTIRKMPYHQVVPGQGLVKDFGGNSYDYALTIGGISYTLNKHFNFTFANDKNFLGDGYRSLFLSDNSFTYPFLRITTDIWRIRYVTINAIMQNPYARGLEDVGFRKKYASFHYLLLGVGKTNRLTIGLFDAVIWRYDTLTSRGYEINYLNPVIFMKPVEESLNSPDNGLLGFSLRYKVSNSTTLYGQLLLDEFALAQVRSGNGWWANKQAFQVGFKSFNLAGVRHLSIQSEFNFVRPYMFQHRSSGQNYAQYNQALGHPLGANFVESVNFARYNYKRWYVEAELMVAIQGLDTGNLNYGGNIFNNYLVNNQPTFVHEYGNRVAQGVRTTLTHETLKFSYLVNPATNMRIELGIDNRTTSNSLQKSNALYVTFGIRTSLINTYYDF